MRKVRNKSAGTIGDCTLRYDRNTGRYHDLPDGLINGQQPPLPKVADADGRNSFLDMTAYQNTNGNYAQQSATAPSDQVYTSDDRLGDFEAPPTY